MKLRSLLHRKQADEVPLLSPDDSQNAVRITGGRVGSTDLEERLERLLTPSEMEQILHHRV